MGESKEWQNIYGGEGEDQGFSIIQTADSGFIAACEISDGLDSNFGFLKLTANGDLVWAKTFKGSNPGIVVYWGTTIQQTQDGGFIAACSFSSDTPNSSDMLVLKLLSNGTTCKLVEMGSIPVTATSVIPIKILSLPMDQDWSISPSSIHLETAPLNTALLCGSGEGKKKGNIRR